MKYAHDLIEKRLISNDNENTPNNVSSVLPILASDNTSDFEILQRKQSDNSLIGLGLQRTKSLNKQNRNKMKGSFYKNKNFNNRITTEACSQKTFFYLISRITLLWLQIFQVCQSRSNSYSNWEKRKSQLIQQDVRSIRTMNYSPTLTDRSKSIGPSPRNAKIKNTINTFKILHEEEKSNISRGGSQAQSSKDVTRFMKINLISAESPTKIPVPKRNSNTTFNRSFRGSNVSIEAQRSGRPGNRNNLIVEPNGVGK